LPYWYLFLTIVQMTAQKHSQDCTKTFGIYSFQYLRLNKMNLKLCDNLFKGDSLTMGLTLFSKLQEITIEVIVLDVILTYMEEPSEGSEGEGD